MRSPQIALLSPDPSFRPPSEWSHFLSLDALQGDTDHDVVVVDMPRDDAADVVFLLRCTPRFRFAPIYARHADSEAGVPLSDGPIPEDPEAIVPHWRLLTERLSMFNGNRAPERFEERILAWLWTRPRATLKPERNTSHPQFYYYPLISAMAMDEPVNDMVWLQLMVEQGWLEREALRDRIRLCSRCSSGRLNYVDVCPECNALEIVRQPSLHCFTCGHVAPQEHFLKEGLMMCPNCLARLRHIGSDYDRPLENYRCQSCQSFFVDADVESRCLDCDTRHTPDELRIREIRQYRLSENGRLRCRQGFSEPLAADQFGRLNLVGQSAFQSMLDWQLQQSRRYGGNAGASLLLLRFANLSEVLNEPHGHVRLDSLVERIQETIRDTDRCTRTREELLWLLLPHTNREGMNRLWQRLSELIKLSHEEGAVYPDIRLAGFSFPEDLLAQEDAQLLMARLAGEVS